MKIDLNEIDRSKFTVKEKNGLYLVNPNYNYVQYTEEELMYRSSIWNEDGELVSAGFKKFFNWDEQAEVSKQPKDITSDCNFIEKIDGSSLIVSKYKNQMIYRTRGTFDVYGFDNSNEIDLFREKYKIDEYMVLFEDKDKTVPYSLLFEWVTPSNKIILDYEKPDFYLVGCINHSEYKYDSQEWLDIMAKSLGVKRPQRYSFNTLEKMFTVKDWINKEGICMYYNNDQSIVKIKSLDYLRKHKFKSNINYESIVDIFVDNKFEYITDLFNYFEQTYDFEIRKYVEEEYLEILLERKSRLCKLIYEFTIFYDFKLLELDRKEQALMIMQRYKVPIERSIAFNLLDKQPQVSDKLRKKFYLTIDINQNN